MLNLGQFDMDSVDSTLYTIVSFPLVYSVIGVVLESLENTIQTAVTRGGTGERNKEKITS